MRWFVAVAFHKPYAMPQDALCTPVEAGAALRDVHLTGPDGRPMRRDDACADNISRKNATWCELTVHYAMLRGEPADVYGLCHYRRYFTVRHTGPRAGRILTQAQAERLLADADMVLPKKRHYWIQTCRDQYTHAHHARDLTVLRGVLAELPDSRYAQALDTTLARRSGHRFNMFLMRRQTFTAYSEWLFHVLGETEKRLDISAYSESDRRVFGYLGERLMDVWVEVNRPRVRECAVVNLESQHWPRKIAAFLMRALRKEHA